MDEPRIYMTDVRDAKLCSKGTRKLFEYYGYDYTSFLQNGITVSEAEKSGNSAVIAIAKRVRERHAKQEGAAHG